MLYSHQAVRPALPPESRYQLTARVAGMAEPRQPDGRVRATLRDVELTDEQGLRHSLPGAYWTWYPEASASLPQDGQRLIMTSSLYHPDGQMNPDGFDFRLYLLQKGIPAGLSGGRDIVWEPATQTGPQSPWLRTRLWLADRLDEALGQDSALLKALLLGARDDLPEDLTRAFRDTGIAHVLSVSGLHTGLLVMVLLALLRWLRIGPKGQLILVAAFLLMYCRLLDFAAPVVRAAVLSLLLLTARLFHRRSDPLTSLAIAFMLILLIRPLDIYQVGFQLSFLAVLGIFTLGDSLERRYQRLSGHRRLPGWLNTVVRALITTLAATLFTAPVTISVFHQLPLLGLLWSPLACVIVAWLMWGALVLIPLGWLVPPLSEALAWPLVQLSRLLGAVSRWLAGADVAAWRAPALGALLTLAIFLVLWLMTRYVRLRPRGRLLIGGLALLLALVPTLWPRERPLRYVQLSAGSADAALIEDGPLTIGIDTGDNGSDMSNYLLRRGRGLDMLYITHLHSDHVGGLRQLLEAGVRIEQIALPYGAMETAVADDSRDILALAADRGIPISFMGAGDSRQFEKSSVRALWPQSGQVYPGMDANHSALTLLWDLDGVSLLTASDLTGDYERYAAHPAQVLKLSHHGSKHSNSEAFLSIVSPQIALLTTADSVRDRASDTLARLERMDCQTYATNEGGALILTVGQAGLSLEQYALRGKR